jgi:hypothetical protein
MAHRILATELAGDWVMTRESLIDIQHVSHGDVPTDPSQYKIALREDGTCHFHTFMYPISSLGSVQPIEDSECRWLLGDIAGRQRLTIQMVGGRFSTMYDFADDVGSLVLWQAAGDPDARQYVDYRRTAGDLPNRGIR